MTYTVIKTINGRRYRYLQETYRENGKVRTRNVYLGPIDGERRRRGGVTGFLQELVRKSDRTVESEEQMKERVAAEDREYAKQDRTNDLLSTPTISMESINEISGMQNSSETAEAENDQAGESEAGESEGEAGEASP